MSEASVTDFDDMWNVNVRGLWLALTYAMPMLSEGAAVIVNSSIASQKGIGRLGGVLRH
jgi:NADP-dependent 3-hydroxy acid dehydrogenase YdfG